LTPWKRGDSSWETTNRKVLSFREGTPPYTTSTNHGEASATWHGSLVYPGKSLKITIHGALVHHSPQKNIGHHPGR